MIGSSYQAAAEALSESIVAITDWQREDRSNRGPEQRSFLESSETNPRSIPSNPSIQIGSLSEVLPGTAVKTGSPGKLRMLT
jgi:hypothetical protein